MKTTIYPVLILFFSAFTPQKKDKLFTYDQQILPGKQAYITDSAGNSKRAGGNNAVRYFIFLQTTPGKEIKITSLWIKGQPYHFDVSKAETPVLVKRQFPGEKKYDTLVAKTEQAVYRIIHNDIIDSKDIKKRKAETKFPVVLYYTSNGKQCVLKSADIKHLPEQMMQ